MNNIKNAFFLIKETLMILLLFLCTHSIEAQKIKEIYVEPHVGFTGEPFSFLGGSAGANLSLYLSEKFAVKTGATFSCFKKYTDMEVILDIPVYASLIIPIGSIKLEMNGGPFLNCNYSVSTMGVSLGATVRFEKVNINISGLKQITKYKYTKSRDPLRFDVSIGIPIKL